MREMDDALMLLGRLQDRGFRTRRLGGDKGYDTAAFVHMVRTAGITPHVAQNTSGRRSNIDGRTTRHAGYATSQKIRKRVEEIFGWGKTVGGLRRTRYRGVERTGFWACIVGAAYNSLRMSKLMPHEATESGRLVPYEAQLRRLARVLGVPVAEAAALARPAREVRGVSHVALLPLV